MNKFSKWVDGSRLAGRGILLALRRKKFWLVFFPTFFVFGTLMNLLSSGFTKFELMGKIGFIGALEIIRDAFLGIFGVNMAFVDWLVIFLVAVLQGLLVSMVVFVWKKKKEVNSQNLERAGISAGLAMLGTGCPTCGTALLAPVIGTIFSGSTVIVGAVSWAVTLLAVLVAIFSLRKIGEDAYVIITSEKYRKRKKEEKNEEGD